MTAFIYTNSFHFKRHLEEISKSLSEGKTLDGKLNVVDKKINENVVAVFFKSIFGFYKRQDVDAIAQTFLKETIHHIKDLEEADINKIASIFEKLGKQNNRLNDNVFEENYNIPERSLRVVYKEIKNEFDIVQKQKKTIIEKDGEIERLKELDKEKESSNEELKKKLEGLQGDIENLKKSNENALQERDKIIEEKNLSIKEKESSNEELKKKLEGLQGDIENLKKSNEKALLEKEKIITQKDLSIKEKESSFVEQSKINENLKSEIEKLKKELKQSNQKNDNLLVRIEEEKRVVQSDKTIPNLKKEIERLRQQIDLLLQEKYN